MKSNQLVLRRRNLRLLRVFAMAVSGVVSLAVAFVALAQTDQFTDIPVDHVYADAIDRASAHGWFQGYADGSFRPDQTISADQMTTVFERAFPDGLTRAEFARFLTTGETGSPTLTIEPSPTTTTSTTLVARESERFPSTGWLETNTCERWVNSFTEELLRSKVRTLATPQLYNYFPDWPNSLDDDRDGYPCEDQLGQGYVLATGTQSVRSNLYQREIAFKLRNPSGYSFYIQAVDVLGNTLTEAKVAELDVPSLVDGVRQMTMNYMNPYDPDVDCTPVTQSIEIRNASFSAPYHRLETCSALAGINVGRAEGEPSIRGCWKTSIGFLRDGDGWLAC